MANNIAVADAGTVTQFVKTTQTATVHVPHHNVDTLTCGFVTVTGNVITNVSGAVTISGGGGFITVSGTLPVQVSGTVPVVVSGVAAVCGDVTAHGLFSEAATLSGKGLFPLIVGGSDGTAARTIFISSAGTIASVISGVVTISGGPLPVNVSGVVTVSGGNVNVVVSGPVTVSGTVVASPSGVYVVSGGNVNVVVSGAVVISGGGGFILTSGSGGFITVTGNLLVSGTVIAVGNVAAGSADSGNPVKTGGVALVTHSVSGTASGARTNIITDKYGAQVFTTWPVDLIQTTGRLISVTGETVIVAATASEFHDIMYMDITHNASSGVLIQIRDVTTSGALTQRYLAAGGGIVITPGTTPWIQGTATAWTAAITTSDVTYSVNVQYRRRI